MKTKLLLIALLTLLTSACTSIIPMLAPTVEHEQNISAEYNFQSHYVDVFGSQMHYVDEGQGEVVVLLHGNPTSSYLWRNIIPSLSKQYRVIAPDLIGLGKSDKPKLDYSLQDHIRYFSEFMSQLNLTNVTLVLHDWGGGIGLTYARTHTSNIKQLALMETLIKPMKSNEMDIGPRYLMNTFRSDDGEDLIVGENYFVEKLLPMMAGRKLSEQEMRYYRAPFITKESRKPIYVFPNEVPIDGTPARNQNVIEQNYQYLQNSSVPLLVLYADPGAILTEKYIAVLRQDLPRAEFSYLGEGYHYLQETHPRKIAQSLVNWLNK